MDDTKKAVELELLDDDGENQAVRAFLQLYGCTASPSVEGMRDHLTEYGFDGCWPEWAWTQFGFLTKGGAQDWLRHLFGLERAALPAPAPIICEDCGDECTAHDPGVCGNCYAMKYRDAAPTQGDSK